MASRSSGETISIGGHQFRLTHPDKVMYPETGTTKADVIHYYVEIAPFMLPHVVGRPATRKRWVDGVGTPAQPGQVGAVQQVGDRQGEHVDQVAGSLRLHRPAPRELGAGRCDGERAAPGGRDPLDVLRAR